MGCGESRDFLCDLIDLLFRGGHGLLLGSAGLFRDDAEGAGVREITPEGKLGVFLEEIGRQNGLAFAWGDFGMDAVESVEAELGIEFRSIVFDFFEVVLEGFLAEEIIEERHDLGGTLDEEIVVDDDETVGEFAVASFAEGMPGIADETVGSG